MFCRKCGAPLRVDDVFCSKCGAKVIREDDQSAAQPEQVQPSAAQNEANETNATNEAKDIKDVDVKEVKSKNPKNLHSSVHVKAASRYQFFACTLIFLFSVFVMISEAHTLYTSPLLIGDEKIVIASFGILAAVCAGVIFRGIIYTRFNQKHYQAALQDGSDVRPYQEVYSIVLTLPASGLVQKCGTGYCWGMFWFNCLCPLFRGDLRWFFAAFVGTIFLSSISMGLMLPLCGPLFAFFYNKRYIRTQLEKGFVSADDIAKEWLVDQGIINI